MNIKEIQDEIVEEFEFLPNYNAKIEYLIDLGKDLEPFPEEYRTEEYFVKGCQSKVWLQAELKNARVLFLGDSDGIIARGFISLLLRIFNNQSPSEILNANLFFADRIGLENMLTTGRSNGIASMIKKIKFYALAFQGTKS